MFGADVTGHVSGPGEPVQHAHHVLGHLVAALVPGADQMRLRAGQAWWSSQGTSGGPPLSKRPSIWAGSISYALTLVAQRMSRPNDAYMQVPSHVEYERATSVKHALSLLSRPETRVLAGGHSLIPMMKLRLAQPELLVDINAWPSWPSSP